MGFKDHGDHVTLDLHGYPTREAAYELAPAFIKTAWRKGCRSITLIHGSPDVRDNWAANQLGRGGTKWALRGSLSRGEWMEWAWNRRSVKHRGLEPNSGAMTIALRPNPDPEPDLPWPECGRPSYTYEGPWHRDK